jgi:hypothetical protein
VPLTRRPIPLTCFELQARMSKAAPQEQPASHGGAARSRNMGMASDRRRQNLLPLSLSPAVDLRVQSPVILLPGADIPLLLSGSPAHQDQVHAIPQSCVSTIPQSSQSKFLCVCFGSRIVISKFSQNPRYKMKFPKWSNCRSCLAASTAASGAELLNQC